MLLTLVLVAAIIATTALLGSTRGPSPQSAAATVTSSIEITPVADTFASPQAPHTVYGSRTDLKASNRPGGKQVIYLRFVIPSADIARVQQAQLRLTRTTHHLSGGLSARSVASSTWPESVTGAKAPAVGPVLASTTTTQATMTVAFDVIAAARGKGVVDIAVTSTLTNGFAQFTSREARSNPPILHLGLSAVSSSSPTTAKPPPSSSTAASRPATSTPATPTSSTATAPSTEPASTSAKPTTGTSTTAGATNGGLARPSCSVSALLVPACGKWWGVDPLAWTGTPVQDGLPQEEAKAQRPMDIVHVYHTNDQLFPTAAEKALALAPGSNRLLLINWKPATDMSWAAVAAGKADSRIDTLAKHINSTFPYPFFLTIYHEPENDVVATAGSGMTAADYSAMYRHVVLRLRSDGVHNAVTVMNYMGFDNWAQQSWFKQLWPGNDVVDWVGIDPYGSGVTSGYPARNLSTLVNRVSGSFPGFYTWITKTFPGKPIMLAEWGVYLDSSNPGGQAAFYQSVADQIGDYPDIKALVYFDITTTQGNGKISDPAATASGLAAYRKLGRNPAIVAPQFSYSK